MTDAQPRTWLVMRSRVALGGRVIAAPSARAQLAAAAPGTPRDPALALRALAGDWQAARGIDQCMVTATSSDQARVCRAQLRDGGRYFFLDLPPGDYTLGGTDQYGNPIEPKKISIAPADGPGASPALGVDLTAQAARVQAIDGPVAPGQRAAPARRRRLSNEVTG